MTARRELAAHARAELALREKHWPQEVQARRMNAGEAEADLAAWRAIVELLETGTLAIANPAVPLWPPIVAAARAAEDRRFEKVKSAEPDRVELEQAFHGRAVALRMMLERSAWAVGQCLSPLPQLRQIERIAA